jgi:hypothetical protein
LLSQSSIPSGIILNRITINPGGKLIFDDAPIDLHVREIYVNVSGSLLIGSETCRMGSNIKITFHGSLLDSNTVDSPSGKTSKGLIADGFVDIHGKQYQPTWTRLSLTAVKGSTWIYLQQKINWEVGQQVVLTTTVFFDCPAVYSANYCYNKKHQNEVKTIIGRALDDTTLSYGIQLDSPLLYEHYAGSEYQGEVALLTRKIVIAGSASNDNFGAHTKMRGTKARGRFSGVQSINGGQLNIMARY